MSSEISVSGAGNGKGGFATGQPSLFFVNEFVTLDHFL